MSRSSTTKVRPPCAVASDCAATSATNASTPPWMLLEELRTSGRWSTLGDAGVDQADPDPVGERFHQRDPGRTVVRLG